ncbi:5-demethoxyubiquinol-8 5-hydroxylase UbiM [Pelomonas cellulosilytica]|uniref:5-demethoxyubiquinol-8 5-hydroxylase UbiM n=1 Tax=Pelomonas cellulosilytica TaxID=2906762 RepID=A0ABS8XX98_9BURK|nr:5-demethoxyubiquinol-8 5-hydroxylase UbiM [Pelomonas sp. P8]MCE4556325.1 5-demethoxyubiquinol-8 5-hydroxylase UbiM [Pelomonas sp. P8]
MDAMDDAGTDVLICGAGPAGLALACALHDRGLRVRVLEQADEATLAQPADDGREIALTHRSRRLLERLGLWQRLPDIAPLRRASVRSSGSSTPLPFEARGQDLGWLVSNRHLRAAAWAGARERGVPVLCGRRVAGFEATTGDASLRTACGEVHAAPLVVAADSRFSVLRRLAGIGARHRDFGRSALLVPLAHDRDHGGLAQECFLAGHTLALLPMNGGRSSAVWTVANAALPRLQALDDAALAAEIEQAAEGRLGAMRVAGGRHVYPLVAVWAERFVAPRFALIGDAAVGMHPVTAHGYNLGLYGIEALSRRLAPGRDPGELGALQAYEAEHRRAAGPMYAGTNALVRFFTDDRAPVLALRRVVIDVARHLPPLRAAITRRLVDAAA